MACSLEIVVSHYKNRRHVNSLIAHFRDISFVVGLHADIHGAEIYQGSDQARSGFGLEHAGTA
jgi:hypothetical protein